MCEYGPGCAKSDDPAAVALWAASPGELATFGARITWLVVCPVKKHPLARLVVDRDGREVLVTPAMKFRSSSMYREPVRPDEIAHFHAVAEPLSEIADDANDFGRCRCGTWQFRPAQIKQQHFGRRGGVPYTTAGYVRTANADGPDTPTGEPL